MATKPKRTRRVGVRELRQNLSFYLARVKKGARLEVTERGHPIAVLGPLLPPDSIIARLAAAGRATRPQGDLLDLGPPPALPVGWRPLNEGLDEVREDKI